MTLEFLVPDFNGPMEPDYLDGVLEVTSTREHAKARAAFWNWLRDFFGDDVLTDEESIEAAVDEMKDLLADLRSATRWKAVKSRSSYLFLAGAVALPFAGGPVAAAVLAAKAAGVVFSHGKFALDKVADRAIDTKPSSPAALFAPEGKGLPFAGRD